MTQNGLKWILNTTSKSMEFCRSDPVWKIAYFFFEGFPKAQELFQFMFKIQFLDPTFISYHLGLG